MRNRVVLAVIVFSCGASITAEPLPVPWQKRTDAIDITFDAAKGKAEDARANAIGKAEKDRINALNKLLSEATKMGNFDVATEVKARVVAAGKESSVQPKPKDVEKFGDHEYALIQERVTWHTAKRKCEQMGGHLVAVRSSAEFAFLQSLCKGKHTVWLGATDNEKEDTYLWSDGTLRR